MSSTYLDLKMNFLEGTLNFLEATHSKDGERAGFLLDETGAMLAILLIM